MQSGMTIEQKSTPEKDKFGTPGVLVWMSTKDVCDFTDLLKMFVQSPKGKEQSQVERTNKNIEVLHDIWTQLNPS